MTAPVRTRPGRMPPWQRRLFWGGMVLCGLSGASYALGRLVGWAPDLLGHHRVLIVHGLSAGLVTYVLGILSMSHIRVGWQLRRHQTSGVANLILLTALVLTGLALYYGPEASRDLTVQGHWVLGAVFAVVLLGHRLPWAERRARGATASAHTQGY